MEWTSDVAAGSWLRERGRPDGAVEGFGAVVLLPHAVLSDGSAEEGRWDAARLTAAVPHLRAHTATPDEVFVAVWDGWGGIVGAPALPSAAPDIAPAVDLAVAARHAEMLRHSIRDPFNNVFRRPEWEPGLLSDEISRGARLEIGAHTHVLFLGALAELADAAWPRRVPWADPDPEWTASPSLVWPADRAWVLVTDPDATATVLSGSTGLIAAIAADPAVGSAPERR